LNAPPKILDHTRARACLWTNLLVLPGLGTWLAGQRSLGALLIAMSLSGVVMSASWVCWLIWKWIDLGQLPNPFAEHLWVAIIGIGLVAASWVWAAVVSVALLKNLPPAKPGQKRSAEVGRA